MSLWRKIEDVASHMYFVTHKIADDLGMNEERFIALLAAAADTVGNSFNYKFESTFEDNLLNVGFDEEEAEKLDQLLEAAFSEE